MRFAPEPTVTEVVGEGAKVGELGLKEATFRFGREV